MPVIRLPGLEVDRVELAKAGFHESQLRMTARIKNPGLLKLKLKAAGFEFEIDHILRLKGTPEEDIELAPKTTQSIPVVFDVGTAKVLRLSWKVLFAKKHTEFELRFHGKVVSKDQRVDGSLLSIVKRGTLEELKK